MLEIIKKLKEILKIKFLFKNIYKNIKKYDWQVTKNDLGFQKQKNKKKINNFYTKLKEL